MTTTLTNTTKMIIELLESLAVDAKYASISTDVLIAKLQKLELTVEQQQAILKGDSHLHEQLLSIESIKCQIIVKDVPDDEDEDENEDTPAEKIRRAS